MSEDQEAQEDEMLALASIYDEDVFHRATSAQGGEIQVLLELPPQFKVVVKGEKQKEYTMCFLPPLVLNFELPADYPSVSSPIFTLSSKWMTRAQMSSLCARLDELWEENKGSVVLFIWFQFLKEETMDFLGIQSPLEIVKTAREAAGEIKKTEAIQAVKPSGSPVQKEEEEDKKSHQQRELSQPSLSPPQLDPRAVLVVDPRSDILPQLQVFDEAQRQRAFDAKVFSCGICFSEKLGADCLCFKECQHVYCKACLTEYFEIQIRDGNVQCLNCPEPKCTSLATPSQVKQLVKEELFARYDRLLLQSTLDLMADVVYCPRQSCTSPVMVEPDTTMGICPACQYAFCTLCKQGYHGISNCKITIDDLREMRDEYLTATDEGKKFLEQRFGKKTIQKAVEESFSRDWLNENCKLCPHCGTNIQKADGCNKMTCTSCKQYFCWLCMGQISRVNPYGHFSNPSSPCYNQLFQGVDDDDDDEDSDDDVGFLDYNDF